MSREAGSAAPAPPLTPLLLFVIGEPHPTIGAHEPACEFAPGESPTARVANSKLGSSNFKIANFLSFAFCFSLAGSNFYGKYLVVFEFRIQHTLLLT